MIFNKFTLTINATQLTLFCRSLNIYKLEQTKNMCNCSMKIGSRS